MSLIYYARNMGLYGTPQEDRDIDLLKSLGHTIAAFPHQSQINEEKANPNGDVMSLFRKVVDRCEILFFRRLIDGKIGAGVADEIQHATGKGIPVLELPTIFSDDCLSVQETRERLRYLGER